MVDVIDNFVDETDEQIVNQFYEYASRHNQSILGGLGPLCIDIDTVLNFLSKME